MEEKRRFAGMDDGDERMTACTVTMKNQNQIKIQNQKGKSDMIMYSASTSIRRTRVRSIKTHDTRVPTHLPSHEVMQESLDAHMTLHNMLTLIKENLGQEAN